MIFTRENTKPIESPSTKQVEASLSHLKGSKRSFANLTNSSGDFIQMAGGGFSCMLEIKTGKVVHRLSQSKPIVPWTDETTLLTSCGEFQLKPNEYFNLAQVIDAFLLFLGGDFKLKGMDVQFE